jgi:hypothetical protein
LTIQPIEDLIIQSETTGLQMTNATQVTSADDDYQSKKLLKKTGSGWRKRFHILATSFSFTKTNKRIYKTIPFINLKQKSRN